MKETQDWQGRWQRAVNSGVFSEIDGLRVLPRFQKQVAGVYQQNRFKHFVSTLKQVFPATSILIGKDCFIKLVTSFISESTFFDWDSSLCCFRFPEFCKKTGLGDLLLDLLWFESVIFRVSKSPVSAPNVRIIESNLSVKLWSGVFKLESLYPVEGLRMRILEDIDLPLEDFLRINVIWKAQGCIRLVILRSPVAQEWFKKACRAEGTCYEALLSELGQLDLEEVEKEELKLLPWSI